MDLKKTFNWFKYPFTGGMPLTHEDLADPMKIEEVIALQDDNDFYVADDVLSQKYHVQALALHDTDTIMLVVVKDADIDNYIARHASKLHFTHFYKYQKNEERRIVMETDKGNRVEVIVEKSINKL